MQSGPKCQAILSKLIALAEELELARDWFWFEIAKRGGDQAGRHPQGGEGGGP